MTLLYQIASSSRVYECRPYRIPLPTWAIALMLFPASLLLIGLVVMPFYNLELRVSASAYVAFHYHCTMSSGATCQILPQPCRSD